MTNSNDSENSPFNRQDAGLIQFLLSRRSGSAKRMTPPGPNEDEVRTILAAASRAPDHGKLFPWRFIIFEGDARARAGDVLASCLAETEPAVSDQRLEIERNRFLRAPLVVAVVSCFSDGKPIPAWEQELSAGAVCMLMLMAATGLGFAASWITEWPAYHAGVAARLGLGFGERIAGFIYIGTQGAPLQERARPDLDAIVTRF